MAIGTSLDRAISLLEAGELVAIPTETVYGLAGNALNPEAVVKIFEVKGRPNFNPLIVHTYSLARVADYVFEIPALARDLAAQFWPGPLTLLLDRRRSIPDLVTAGNPRVAIRVPQHPLTLELLARLDFPLAAPSANPSGYISPTSAQHVEAQLGDKIPYILDGGPATVGIESSIIGFEEEQVIVYRLGGLSLEEIEAVCGPVKILNHSENPTASGMLKSHYAPRSPLVLGELEELIPQFAGEDLALLCFDRTFPEISPDRQFLLAPNGDLRIAAQNLFAGLRTLDRLGVARILAQRVPDFGLGRAINDRLQRASY
jgi:L-threonylcarbamoyladenylate synthase